MGMFGNSLVGGAFGGQIKPLDEPQMNYTQFQQQPAKKQAFFGQGGAGRNIAGYIGDALAQLGGLQPQFAPAMRDQREFQQRMALDEQRRNAPQQVGNDLVVPDGQGGFKVVYQGQREQAPLEIDRLADAAGIPQDQRSTYYRQALDNKVNPIQAVPYTDEAGNSGLQFIRPRSMAPNAPQGTPPGVTFTPLPPQGGAGPQAPRPFR